MDRYFELVNLMKEAKKVAVAFSGGVDSSLVAKAAVDAGIETVAITIDSPLFSRREIKNASLASEEIGIRQIVVKSCGLPVENTPMRCYHCKKNVAKLWKKVGGKRGFHTIADGVTVTDINDRFRPGVDASSEEKIWHPLVDAGFTKEDVVAVARNVGLSMWDKPSDACLASRISYGEAITLKKLGMVEGAEDFLIGLSKKIRVRIHDSIARIEVLPEDFEKIVGMREQIIEKFKKIGFTHITLDLRGYRSGSTNEELNRRP